VFAEQFVVITTDDNQVKFVVKRSCRYRSDNIRDAPWYESRTVLEFMTFPAMACPTSAFPTSGGRCLSVIQYGNRPVGSGIRLLVMVAGEPVKVLGERVRTKGVENDDGDRWQYTDTTI